MTLNRPYIRCRRGRVARWSAVVAAAAVCLTAAPAPAQTLREINLIRQLGEAIARPAPATASKAPRETPKTLKAFEGRFRSAAAEVAQKRRQAMWAKVSEAREKAMAIVGRRDLSKQMIQQELDPIFQALEQSLSPARSDVLANNTQLARLREQLAQADPQQLERSEEKWLRVTLAPDRNALEILSDNVRASARLDREESRGVAELNRMRMILGLRPLALDLKLVEASRGHSRDMAHNDFFSHTSPLPGKRSPGDRAQKAGTTASAENIAMGTRSGTAAIRMWWYSPGHLRNMLGGHARVAQGHYGGRWTQMFGG